MDRRSSCCITTRFNRRRPNGVPLGPPQSVARLQSISSARDCISCFVQQPRRFIDKPGSPEFGKKLRWVLPWIRVPKENGSRFVRIEVHYVAELHDSEHPREVVGMSQRTCDHYSANVVGIRRILAQINVDTVNRVLEAHVEAAMLSIPACRLCGEDIADNVIREADGFPISVVPDERFDAHGSTLRAELVVLRTNFHGHWAHCTISLRVTAFKGSNSCLGGGPPLPVGSGPCKASSRNAASENNL